MDTRQLEFFVAVADELSFTRAAVRVDAVQSTVSAGVSALERSVGTALFTRSTRTVRLTAAGAEILPHARRILAETAAMRAIGDQTRRGLRGRVRVGIISGLGLVDVPGILRRFHADHPDVELSLSMSPRGSAGLVEDVRRGRTDVAWVGGLGPHDADGLATAPVLSLPYVAVLPTGHPLAGAERPLRIEELLDDPHVDMPRGYGSREQVERWLDARGLSRRVVAEIPDLAQIPAFVRAGLGVAVTVDELVPQLPGTVQRALAPRLEWALELLASTDPSPAAAALFATARAMRVR